VWAALAGLASLALGLGGAVWKIATLLAKRSELQRDIALCSAAKSDVLVKYARALKRIKRLELNYGNLLKKYASDMSVTDLIALDNELHETDDSS